MRVCLLTPLGRSLCESGWGQAVTSGFPAGLTHMRCTDTQLDGPHRLLFLQTLVYNGTNAYKRKKGAERHATS